MTRPNISKYRPVLTVEQISHLLSLCKRDGSSLSLRCIGVLAPFEYKIQNGSVSSAYDGMPPKDLSSDLGFSPSIAALADNISNNAEIYEMWRNQPTDCNTLQIQTARDYAFANGLLTSEELRSYEHDLFGI